MFRYRAVVLTVVFVMQTLQMNQVLLHNCEARASLSTASNAKPTKSGGGGWINLAATARC